MKFRTALTMLSIMIIVLGITLIEVQAQVIGRISIRCFSNGIIERDVDYNVHQPERYTGYDAILTAGRCVKHFQGRVDTILNVEQAIKDDINNRIVSENMQFHPGYFEDNQITGRFSDQIP